MTLPLHQYTPPAHRNRLPKMSLVPSESIDAPLVRILNQRVGGEKATNDNVCLDGVFDKYTVSTPLSTSQRLDLLCLSCITMASQYLPYGL